MEDVMGYEKAKQLGRRAMALLAEFRMLQAQRREGRDRALTRHVSPTAHGVPSGDRKIPAEANFREARLRQCAAPHSL